MCVCFFFFFLSSCSSFSKKLNNQKKNFRNSTDKRTLIENYDLVSLAIDEIVDDGIILEVDPVVVASRVTRPPAQDVVGVKGIEFSEQGIMNAWELIKTRSVDKIRHF